MGSPQSSLEKNQSSLYKLGKGFFKQYFALLRLDVVALFPGFIVASLPGNGPALLLLLLSGNIGTLLLRNVATLLLRDCSALLSGHIGALLPGHSPALLTGDLLIDGLALPAWNGAALLGLHLLGDASALLARNLRQKQMVIIFPSFFTQIYFSPDCIVA